MAQIRVVLFAKDLDRVAGFYTGALGFVHMSGDGEHAVLRRDGFVLVVHRVPPSVAASIEIASPPARRTSSALRLDYTIASVADARRLARSLGGEVDDAPAPWAGGDTRFFLGHDPEGNPFGLREIRA
jgi:hypothetical protein